MADQGFATAGERASAPRELIYATHGSAGRVLELGGLQQMGWNLRRAPDARGVLRILGAAAARPHAGLLDLREGFDRDDLVEYGDALAARNVGWIAGVDAAQLGDATVRQLIADYCYDYVTLPCPAGVLGTVLGHVHGMAALACERESPPIAGEVDAGMVGESAAMQSLWQTLRKTAMTNAPVLITGEPGTGKELAARALHRQSRRSAGPLVVVHCAELAAEGIASMPLLGGVSVEPDIGNGAAPKRGALARADGGTLLLDDIGDLPAASQIVLLRYLQHAPAGRGDGMSLRPDVRIVSTSEQDLAEAVAEGRFRADLYHRLGVLKLQLPPLRDRDVDIERLAEHTLRLHAGEASHPIRGLSSCARMALRAHEWPGNVRELINRVRRAVAMADGRLITAADLELDTAASRPPPTLDETRDAATREALVQAMQRNRGRLVDTARELGISRVTLYRLLNRHGLRHPGPDAD